MTHYYNDGKYKKPGVTSIISDCHDKSGPLCQWSANMVVEWIKNNKDIDTDLDSKGNLYYIISDDDLNNARMNYRDVSEKALNIGSEAHAAIEEWLKFNREPLDPRPEVLAAFVAFLEFWDEHKMEAIKIEHSVIGDYWGGTLDYYGMFDDKYYVIDFKTSKYHYPNEHGPQIAAYRSALEKSQTIKPFEFDTVDGCGVLRLDKLTGYPDFKDYSKRYEKDLEHFRLMVPLYLHRHPRIAKGAGYNPSF